jgi:hypothetical protein
MMQDSHPVLAGFGVLTIVLIVMAILLVPKIFYLFTLQKAFSRCSPDCRAMNPGMVWLMLIPLFGSDLGRLIDRLFRTLVSRGA